ncbi:MAG: hypothetical protein ACREDO_11400 [Methyloceanibacter sp.]
MVLAAIPAAIIVAIIYGLLFAILGSLFVGILEMIGVPVPKVPTPPSSHRPRTRVCRLGPDNAA